MGIFTKFKLTEVLSTFCYLANIISINKLQNLKIINKIFFPLLIVIIFSGCVTKVLSSDKPIEVFAEKKVLVYDKTISFPYNIYPTFIEFSPTTKNELAVALHKIKIGRYDFEDATRFVLIDSESGKIKKDMELGEYIKPNGEKGDYQGAFFYSDNGDKLHLRKSIHDASSGQYSVLDLNTGKISSSYIYSCDELIPEEYKNKEAIGARCSNRLKAFYDFGAYFSKTGSGILLFDENSLKIKKIITADNRLDTEFKLDSLSEDKRYILFRQDRKPNVKYIVYDIKDEKVIYSFDTPFTNFIAEGFFINRDILLFSHSSKDGIYIPATKSYKRERHIGIINLATNEKRVLSSGLDEFKHRPNGGGMIAGPDTYNLNSRYIIWRFSYEYFIFDIREMKIVQQLKVSAMPYTVSKDSKKVAFIKDDKIYIYNIVEGE